MTVKAPEKKLIEAAEPAERLDIFLSAELRLSRSYIKQLIDGGNILLNSKSEKAGKSIKKGDIIEVSLSPVKDAKIIPEDISLDILYEDDDIAVINKSQGMTVHPGGGAYTGTLVNALMHNLKNLSAINGEIRPGIVHRLDKDTSGVMVVAKSDAAHLNLAAQIQNRTVEKIYTALLDGVVKSDGGTIKTFIGRSEKNRKLMAVVSSGREAISVYKVIRRYESNTLTEFNILTGRTHQIRVHAKYIGHPVTGDKSYGSKKQRFNLAGQLLHAKLLSFNHPVTNKRVTFMAPLPDYFERVLKILEPEVKE